MKLSVIIPCYNEAKDIAKKAEIVKEKLATLSIDSELILVNDGSKDDTKEVISTIDGVMASGYDVNKGKGGAIQKGILDATGDYILFMDADLSTDLEAIDRLLPMLNQYDMVIGSRHHKESEIPVKQPFIRRFIGWGCRTLVRWKFHIHYTDTQCGFKAIRRDIAKLMAERQIIMGFAFDVEYLYMAKLNNWTVQELPVTWRDDRGSTVSPVKSSIKFFKDMRKIKKNKKNYIVGN